MTVAVTALAEILAGLGLLFVGLRIMSTHLQQATGRKVRRLLRGATRSPLAGLACGTLAGAATQSSNAVAVICGNLVRGGIFSTRDAVPVVAGGNVGTAALVFIAAIDFRLVVLYLVAAVGFGFHLRLDRRTDLREWMGVALGLALVLLGLDFIKHGPAGIVPETLSGALGDGISPLAGFGIGFLAALLTQSASTSAILVVALLHARLLGLHDAFFLVLGANLGSGVAVLLSSGGLRGTGRQLCYVHVMVKAVGCAVVAALFAVAGHLGGDPFALLAAAGGGQAAAAVSVLFLLLQCAGALPVALLRGRAEAVAGAFSPPTIEDDAARPRFIHEQAAGDPVTALDLAGQETLHLVGNLPLLLPDLDAEVGERTGAGAADRLGRWRGGASVALALDHFLADLMARGLPRASLRVALHHQQMLETVRALQDTLHDFNEVIEGFEDLPPLAFNLSESLRAIILSLADAAKGGPEDVDVVVAIAADRSELLNRVRRQLAASALDPQDAARQLLLATSLFERAVWLVRRVAVALRTSRNDANRVAPAAVNADLKRVEVDAHRA